MCWENLALLPLPIPLKNKKRAKANVPNAGRQKKFSKMRSGGFFVFLFLSVGEQLSCLRRTSPPAKWSGYCDAVHEVRNSPPLFWLSWLYVILLHKLSNCCVIVYGELSPKRLGLTVLGFA